MLCIWMNTQLWDTELLLGGSPCSRRLGDETGSVNRNGQLEFDVYWLDGHPNRRGGSIITGTEATVAQYCRYIKGLPTKDWGLSNRPAVWNSAPEYPPILVICSNDSDRTWIVFRCGFLFKLLAGWMEMTSGSFLKSVSESNLDKLYALPENIQDVMGLQALRPSAAVCKVMTIPDSNCIRIVTPDEHVPTGFHEILIYDKRKRNIHKCQPNNQRNLSKRNQYNNSVIRNTRPMARGRNYKTLQGKGQKRKML